MVLLVSCEVYVCCAVLARVSGEVRGDARRWTGDLALPVIVFREVDDD